MSAVLSDGKGAAGLEHRFQWTAPLLISPHDPNVLYHGGERLFRTTDAGMHWEAISGDLTRNDKSKQQPSGGPITIDDTGTEYYDTIFAVAESPLVKGLIWAGADDGLVHVTRDGGKNWADVTPKEMPEWSKISQIDASPHDPGTAWVAVDRHANDDLRPYIYATTDYGADLETAGARASPKARSCAPCAKIPSARACCSPERKQVFLFHTTPGEMGIAATESAHRAGARPGDS